MGAYDSYKKQVLDVAMDLAREGLLIGSGGNVSIRVEGEQLLAITPSGKDYLDLALEDICVVDFERNVKEGHLEPSVETRMHSSIYKTRQDVMSVIHTHQIFPSIFALLNEPIPALFDEQVANLGDRIEVVEYAMSGSSDLMANITAKVGNNCNAFILQNHGSLVLGMNIQGATRNVRLLEKTAAAYYHALALGREVTLLPSEIARAIFDILKSEQRKEIRRRKKLARKQKQKAQEISP